MITDIEQTQEFFGNELRAGERVLKYLLTEFDRPHLREGSRLPTNKELAKRLNVSLGTVQTALRRLVQNGQIRAQRGSGTYLVSRSTRESETLKIGIGAPLEILQTRDEWKSRMGGGIFQAALNGQVTLEGVSNQSFGTTSIVDEIMDKKSKLDALILLPYVFGPQHDFLIDAFEDAGKPVIRIHPPTPTATANFVTTDFFGSSFAVGRAWHQSKRRRVLALTREGERSNLRLGVSSQLRHSGLVSGLGPDLWKDVSFQTHAVSCDEMTEEEAGYHAMKRLLAEGQEPPDAVYCGDWLALGAVHALREAGLRIPEDVSVIGCSGMDLSQTDCPGLSRIRHDLERVGSAAVELALERIKMKGISLPGVVVPTSFIRGTTTLPTEAALFGSSTSPRR